MQENAFPGDGFALAIETSGVHGSVAVGRGTLVLAIETFSRPLVHASAFLPAIREVCRAANAAPGDIAEVYVSQGPGSFTGLRLGITAARTIALACGSRLAAVPTLEIIANNVRELANPPTEIIVILDAKRAHVYAQAFALRDESILPIDVVAEVDPRIYLKGRGVQCGVIGDGVKTHLEAVSESGCMVLPEHLFRPRAEVAYRLGIERARRGEFVDRRDLTPLYVRVPEAEERWEARHGV